MGARIKDSTTLDILVQLNKRFDVEMVSEMAALQNEFKVFSGKHSLRQSFALLGLVQIEDVCSTTSCCRIWMEANN